MARFSVTSFSPTNSFSVRDYIGLHWVGLELLCRASLDYANLYRKTHLLWAAPFSGCWTEATRAGELKVSVSTLPLVPDGL